jgi:ELWxxDGT repeat protein
MRRASDSASAGLRCATLFETQFNGRQLWSTNGTEAGTTQVSDLSPWMPSHATVHWCTQQRRGGGSPGLWELLALLALAALRLHPAGARYNGWENRFE